MRQKNAWTGAMMVLIMLFLAGCAPATEQDQRIRVVTTIGMITDIVENVGGEHVQVKGLMGPGVDPHLYKASEGDVRKLSSADIIFYGGLHLEARMGEILEEMDGEIRTVAVTQDIPREELLDFAGYPGQYDPHVWFNVRYWMLATETVERELSLLDPAHETEYQARAAAYLLRLEELDAYVLGRADELLPEQRVLVTAHDAFQYFGRAYGFEVIGLQGISTAAEAGTADVQRLVDLVAERRIPAIFIESSVPERNIRAVQEGVKAKGWDVRIGGELYSDAMGEASTPDGTYIGMVTHNIDTIVDGLKGNGT